MFHAKSKIFRDKFGGSSNSKKLSTDPSTPTDQSSNENRPISAHPTKPSTPFSYFSTNNLTKIFKGSSSSIVSSFSNVVSSSGVVSSTPPTTNCGESSKNEKANSSRVSDNLSPKSYDSSAATSSSSITSSSLNSNGDDKTVPETNTKWLKKFNSSNQSNQHQQHPDNQKVLNTSDRCKDLIKKSSRDSKIKNKSKRNDKSKTKIKDQNLETEDGNKIDGLSQSSNERSIPSSSCSEDDDEFLTEASNNFCLLTNTITPSNVGVIFETVKIPSREKSNRTATATTPTIKNSTKSQTHQINHENNEVRNFPVTFPPAPTSTPPPLPITSPQSSTPSSIMSTSLSSTSSSTSSSSSSHPQNSIDDKNNHSHSSSIRNVVYPTNNIEYHHHQDSPLTTNKCETDTINLNVSAGEEEKNFDYPKKYIFSSSKMLISNSNPTDGGDEYVVKLTNQFNNNKSTNAITNNITNNNNNINVKPQQKQKQQQKQPQSHGSKDELDSSNINVSDINCSNGDGSVDIVGGVLDEGDNNDSSGENVKNSTINNNFMPFFELHKITEEPTIISNNNFNNNNDSSSNTHNPSGINLYSSDGRLINSAAIAVSGNDATPTTFNHVGLMSDFNFDSYQNLTIATTTTNSFNQTCNNLSLQNPFILNSNSCELKISESSDFLQQLQNNNIIENECNSIFTNGCGGLGAERNHKLLSMEMLAAFEEYFSDSGESYIKEFFQVNGFFCLFNI